MSPTPAAPTPTAISPACPKCGSIKKSGQRSCCARGGSWFQKCGDVGDSRFVHTWAEGMQACECKRTIFSPSLSLSLSCIIAQCSNTSGPDSPLHNDHQSHMPQVRWHQELRQAQLLCSGRFLVPEMRRCRRLKICSYVDRGHASL